VLKIKLKNNTFIPAPKPVYFIGQSKWLAIHPFVSDNEDMDYTGCWTLTHVPSGLEVVSYQSLYQVCRVGGLFDYHLSHLANYGKSDLTKDDWSKYRFIIEYGCLYDAAGVVTGIRMLVEMQQ